MKYLFATVTVLLFSFLQLSAQSDFRDGYIVKNENDTIYGLIDYRGNKVNSKKCVFKKDINAEKQVFTPNELTGYRFTDSKYYVSKEVDIEGQTELLFLEFLINGVVDVYYYRDELGEDYLIDDGSGNLYELRNDKEEVVKNQVRYLKESKEYVGVLKAIFRESPMVFKKVDNINLNHKSLINVSRDYHNEVCDDQECIVYEKKLPKSEKAFGIVLGFYGMSISGINDSFISERESGFTTYPAIGLYYKVNMPYFNERCFFLYEGTYSRGRLSTSYAADPGNGLIYINSIDLIHDSFNNLVVIKYEFPKGKVKPTFQIGMFAKYLFGADYTRTREARFAWGDTNYVFVDDDIPFSSFDFGINTGVGLKSEVFGKELYLDIRYQRGVHFSAFHPNTFLLSLGYQISK